MKRLLVAIAAVGLLASAFAFFASPASAATDSFTINVQPGDGTVQATVTPEQGCIPDEGQQQGAGPVTYNVPDFDPETLQLDTDCDYTITFAHASCTLQGSINSFANADGGFQPPDAAVFMLDAEGGVFTQSDFFINVQNDDCAANVPHDVYKNVPIADRDVFALTTFSFIVTPSEDFPANCTSATVDITGDGSPAVVLTATVADSVLVGNSVQECEYDITEVPVAGWTNTIPLIGNTQFNQNPFGNEDEHGITPFRNTLDPVPLTVTKSMDLEDFVVLSNIDTDLLDELIVFEISAPPGSGCADTIITDFDNQLGSTGTFVNTTPAQVELAGFNDNVFTGEDVPVVVDGVPCTYTVLELASEDLLEYCAPAGANPQTLTWAPGVTSLDFLFHNDCEVPVTPTPTPTGTPTASPTQTPGGGGDGGGGPSFAG